eukprot:TRINITY_DN7566_c0_g1_i1.p1 TRINITY_DN7566_c0_g1~~TRINITY_DN7566_c0_g1_i1.p1  ORF type:complete len:819 (-),score=76.26 TRINITY_DN7566_c0_g1_i1:268-2724(-)
MAQTAQILGATGPNSAPLRSSVASLRSGYSVEEMVRAPPRLASFKDRCWLRGLCGVMFLILVMIVCFAHLGRYMAAGFCAHGLIVPLALMATSTSPPRLSLRLACVCGMVCITALVTATPWILHGGAPAALMLCSATNSKSPGQEIAALKQSSAIGQLILMFITLAVAAFSVCISHPPSSYTRSAVRCLVLQWYLDSWGTFWMLLLWCSPLGGHDLTVDSDPLILFAAGAICMLSVISGPWYLRLLHRRISALEDSAGKSFGANVLQTGFWLLGITVALGPLGALFPAELRMNVASYFWSVLQVELAILAVTHGAVAIRAFVAPAILLRRELKDATGAAAAELRWAFQSLMRELIAAVALSITTALAFGSSAILPPVSADFNAVSFPLVAIDAIANVSSLLILSGLSGRFDAHPCVRHIPADGPPKLELELHQDGESESETWMKTVDDLAKRGFSIRSLLTFFKRLGTEVMFDYDPLRSTTNDVVRQAIIPLSSDGHASCSMAQLLMNHEPTLPQMMVSHTWDGLFSELVASVIAEVLGTSCYGEIAENLASAQGFDAVVSLLDTHRKLDVTVWICALSIDQHSSICGGFGPPPADARKRQEWERKTKDSVTGETFTTCSCGKRKLFNDAHDLTELNKFDSMLAFLKRRIENFKLVAYVDRRFVMFSRAWCVAELVVARTMSIPISVKLRDAKSLDDNYTLLSNLSVEDCEASREQDKLDILAKIHDVKDFDAYLTHLIFATDGILTTWMDAEERQHAIHRVLRRIYVGACTDSTEMSAMPSQVADVFPAASMADADLSDASEVLSRGTSLSEVHVKV